MSKARLLADLISDSQITASEITGLELNAIQQGDTIVEVSDTGSGGKVVVRVDGADSAEFNAGGIKVPSGTTAQRDPNAVVGSLRYNTTIGFFETFTGAGWGSVATPPSITNITPSNFNGEAGATFTINGAFFDTATTAVFKGADGTEYAAATVTFVSSTQITITNATNLSVANEPFRVAVTNGAGLTAESTQGIDAGSVPAFTTAAGNIATTARWDDAVSVTVQASDAENTISGYAVTQGNLPAGLSLNTTTGAITGTSTEQTTTTYTFTIEATDSAGNTNTRQFNIQIVNAAPVWSSPAEGGTEDLTKDSAGSITLNATDPEGETISYTSGTLPTGLSLSGNVISGTPTVTANTNVAVTASDGFASSIRSFYINVAPVAIGEALFTTPGTYQWVVPVGVSFISAVAVGVGGRGGPDTSSAGQGGACYIRRGSTNLVIGYGGSGAGGGGSYIGDGGGSGGGANYSNEAGGGGAGGYSGNGGNSNSTNNGPGNSGTGGGGGGGGTGGAGGGVGLYGEGSSGARGTTAWGNDARGRGGSGGSDGGYWSGAGLGFGTGGTYGGGGMNSGQSGNRGGGGGGLGWISNFSVTAGETLTVLVSAQQAQLQDGNSAYYFGKGGPGAVRILWGPNRTFPSTNVDLASSLGSVTAY